MLYIPDCPTFLSTEFNSTNTSSSKQLLDCCTQLYNRCVHFFLLFGTTHQTVDILIWLAHFFFPDISGQNWEMFLEYSKWCWWEIVRLHSEDVRVFKFQCDDARAVERDGARRIHGEQFARLLHTFTPNTVQLQPGALNHFKTYFVRLCQICVM